MFTDNICLFDCSEWKEKFVDGGDKSGIITV